MASTASGLHLGYQRYSRQRMTSQIRSVADSSSLMPGEKRAILTGTCLAALCIGNLNHLFSGPSNSAGPGSCQFSFLFDENRGVASAGLGDAAVGGALSVPDRTARSNSERAVPSASVGNRFRFLRSVD